MRLRDVGGKSEEVELENVEGEDEVTALLWTGRLREVLLHEGGELRLL